MAKEVSLYLGLAILVSIISFYLYVLGNRVPEACNLESSFPIYSDCLISVSDLEASPYLFAGKEVNVKGKVFVGTENFTLGNIAEAESGSIWVNYKKFDNEKVVSESWQKIQYGYAYLCTIPMVLSGKYELGSSGHFGGWQSRLSNSYSISQGSPKCQ